MINILIPVNDKNFSLASKPTVLTVLTFKHFPPHIQFGRHPILYHIHKAIITTELSSK